MTRTPIMPGLLLALGAGPLAAAEVSVQDLRVVAESRPLDVTWEWEDRLGGSSRPGTLSSAWAAGLGLRRGWGRAARPWQVVVGVEALAVEQRAPGFRDQALALRGEAGAAYTPVHRLALLALVGAGAGWSRATLEPQGAAAIDLAGGAVEAGARAGLRWQAGRSWALGAEAGWLITRERLSGDGATLRLEAAGPWLGLSLAWVPDPLPAALDR